MPNAFASELKSRGRDGTCGKLTGVIIDPVARALTNLIVKPGHHRGFGRLVPLKIVESGRRLRSD